MKRRKPLPIPQKEFGFTPNTFNLYQDCTSDGERTAREREEVAKTRQLGDAAQSTLFTSKRQ
jgi:hypothetical protein